MNGQNGVNSVYYLNGLLESPTTLRHTAMRMRRKIQESQLQFNTIAFRGLSGGLLAPIVAMQLNTHLTAVRKDDCYSHSQHKIEGWNGGGPYIIIDDLIDSGETIHKIAEGCVTGWKKWYQVQEADRREEIMGKCPDRWNWVSPDSIVITRADIIARGPKCVGIFLFDSIRNDDFYMGSQGYGGRENPFEGECLFRADWDADTAYRVPVFGFDSDLKL